MLKALPSPSISTSIVLDIEREDTSKPSLAQPKRTRMEIINKDNLLIATFGFLEHHPHRVCIRVEDKALDVI